jgi:hypothetical protein
MVERRVVFPVPRFRCPLELAATRRVFGSHNNAVTGRAFKPKPGVSIAPADMPANCSRAKRFKVKSTGNIPCPRDPLRDAALQSRSAHVSSCRKRGTPV